MDLCFDGLEIERWARFSGDRNPIHFDLEAARRLDVDEVVVHGMLVLLPVKRRLSEATMVGKGSWMRFKTSLKAPVPRCAMVSLAVRERESRTTFSVCSNGATGQEFARDHLVGDIKSIEAREWDSLAPVHEIDTATMTERFDSFLHEFGPVYPTWVMLDAVVFSHFIQNQIGHVYGLLDETPISAADQRSRIEDFPEHLLIQISHETSFCPTLVDSAPGQYPPEVAYQIDNVCLTQEGETAFGTLDLGIKVRGRHVMTIVLGLMVKKQVQPQQRKAS